MSKCKSSGAIALVQILLTSFMLVLSGCGGGGSPAASQTFSIKSVTTQTVTGNTVALTAIAVNNTGSTRFCFKTDGTTPLPNDPCFQASNQFVITLTSGVTNYVWATDATGSVTPAFRGPCSTAGYAASDLSNKNTVCMLTSKGEIVYELDAAKAPVTVANFLQYVNSGFYSLSTFYRVSPNFMNQGGGYTYNWSTSSYMAQTVPYGPIALEPTLTTGLSNIRGTIAMARSSLPNSATDEFFVNVVNNSGSLDSATAPDGYGYAVFGHVISGLSVLDAMQTVPLQYNYLSRDTVSTLPVTPIIIDWAYQIK